MSKRTQTLALAYLKEHPKSAARTLEEGASTEIADFLGDTPAAFSAPVLAHMLPQTAARACRQMPDETVSSILALLEPVTLAALFRYLPDDTRKRLQPQLPARKKRAVATLLGFSQNLVGSWMIPDAPVLPSDGTGTQAKTVIQSTDSRQKSDYLFAVDRERNLVGRIHISDAIALSPAQSISPALTQNCRALNGRLTLDQAAEHPDWDTIDVMPVVGPNNRYTGVIRHVDLRRGLRHLVKMSKPSSSQGSLGNNAADYAHGLIAALNGMAHMLETDTRS